MMFPFFFFSIKFKDQLRKAILCHLALYLLILVKMFDDVLDRMDILIPSIAELAVPKPLLWEYIWMLSIIPSFSGLASLSKNRLLLLQIFFYGTIILGILPVLGGMVFLGGEALEYAKSRHTRNLFLGMPVVIMWYMFFVAALQIHGWSLYLAYHLQASWNKGSKSRWWISVPTLNIYPSAAFKRLMGSHNHNWIFLINRKCFSLFGVWDLQTWNSAWKKRLFEAFVCSLLPLWSVKPCFPWVWAIFRLFPFFCPSWKHLVPMTIGSVLFIWCGRKIFWYSGWEYKSVAVSCVPCLGGGENSTIQVAIRRAVKLMLSHLFTQVRVLRTYIHQNELVVK